MKKKIVAAFAILGLLLIALAGCAKINVNIMIEFESNGGTPCATIRSNDADSIKMPNNPKKEGYVFDGWYWDDGVWEKPFTVNSILDMPISDRMNIKVYAKWKEEGEEKPDDTVESLTITFDENGGQGSYEKSRIVWVGEKLYVLPTVTRVGYTFDGWYTAGIDGKKITEGYVVDFAQDTTLVAKWTANTYKVIFESDGADGVMQPQTLTYDKAQALSANAFTKAGYQFAGWKYGSKNFTDKQTVKNLAVTGEIVLTAVWRGNEYTVAFDGNGATSEEIADKRFVYGGDGSLWEINRNTYRTGYDLVGWQCGERIFDGGGIPSDFIPDDGARLTFKAIWQAITYTVYFSQNGSNVSGSMSSITMTYDQDYTLPLCTFMRKGYIFAYWSCDDRIADGETVRNLTDWETTVYLYAQWTPITYTIAYDGNGADSGEMPNQTATYDQSFSLATNGFIKNGYEFAYYTIGESDKLYFSGAYITESLADEQDAVVTVKAIWQPVYEGEGTEKSPYKLRTAADVHGLNVLFRKNAASTYKKDLHILLDADIDMQGETLVPIDERYSSGGFAYVIDGGGHTLSNYIMNSTANRRCGLITSNYGTIKNLNISEAHLDVRQYVADMGVLTGRNTGTIYNCSVVDSHVTYTAERGFERSEVGGLVGDLNSGSVKNCYFTGSITANQPDGSYLCVGGIAGRMGNGLILSSYANVQADVTTKDHGLVGGVAGFLDGATSTSSESRILYSFAAGAITVNIDDATAYAGGIAGSGKAFVDCYHSVSVRITATSGEVCEPTCTANFVEDGNLRNKEWIVQKLPPFAGQGWAIGNNAYPVFGASEEISVIEIGTKEQLTALSGSMLSGNYKLTANIDLGGAEWKPSKNLGLFDGGGFTISNFTVKTLSGNRIGFFAENFGTVKNLILSDFTLTAETFGSITAGGIAARNYGKIAYCKTAGTIGVQSQSSGIRAGGISGNSDTGEISDCYAQVNITVTSYANSVYAGGIAATVTAGEISRCYTTGIINGVTGGVVGNNAYLYGVAPYAEHSFSLCDFTTKDREMHITLAAVGSTNYGCTTQKRNSLTASSGMYVLAPYNFGNPAFLEKMGFGNYVSADDLTVNPGHAWILQSENLPKLYFEKQA